MNINDCANTANKVVSGTHPFGGEWTGFEGILVELGLLEAEPEPELALAA